MALAFAWNLVALAALQAGARAAGWWRFGAHGGLLLGMPVDLYLGWALLWSAIPCLAAPDLAPAVALGLAFGLDLLAMPGLAPLVQLGPRWLAGEAIGCVLCLLPGLLLGRWTRDGTHLAGRATLQAIAFAGLTLFLLPEVILEQTGGSWQHLLGTPRWAASISAQLLCVPGMLGLAAVQELAARGRGTPVPFDPPARLVTSGPYAYVSNPMQLAVTLLLLGWGAALGSPWVAAAGLVGHLYSAGFAASDEQADLVARFGDRYRAYRREVRAWVPRWRPWHPSLVPPLEVGPPGKGMAAALLARLYLAEGCLPCSQLRRWLAARHPTGLILLSAEDHPDRDLERLAYDPADGGAEESGVAAIGRTLEHLHLGYALVGWTVRLPLLRPLLQLVADAAGAFPRRVRRRCLVAGAGHTPPAGR